MKILTISAHYPPYHSGGYGIRIKNIMDGLAERGHKILVLSTQAEKYVQSGDGKQNYPIERILHNHYEIKRFFKELYFDLLDVELLRRYINDVNPDLIYLGHIYPITKQLMPFLSSLSIPILFDEGGNGLKGAWTDHGRWFRLLTDYNFDNKLLNNFLPFLRRNMLLVNHGKLMGQWAWPENMSIIFNSELNLDNARNFGVPVQSARVIHSGVDTEIFKFKTRLTFSAPLIIIVPGRIEPKKGQIDAVKLLNELKKLEIDAELTLVGTCADADYFYTINEEISKLGLHGKVTFSEMVSQDQLVQLYYESDICYFSSYHRSGFSRVPLEAMSSGCIVISYGNEGSDEIIKEGFNGFLVEPGDIGKSCEIIRMLKNSPDQMKEVCSTARKEVAENYSLLDYIKKIELVIYLVR